MQTLNSLELEIQNNLWDLVNTIRNRMPINEHNFQQSLTATIHDLETLKGCAEILSFDALITVCLSMSEIVISGLQGTISITTVSESLMVHLDQSLILLCTA